LFTELEIGKLIILSKAVMPIYNQPGSNTGLVVHVGGATTTVAPVIGGKAAPGTIQTC